MKNPSYRRFNKGVSAALVERFLNGEKLSLIEIAEEYLGPQNTTLARIMSNRRARCWVDTAKSRLQRENEVLACIDETPSGKGIFGIVDTAGHARYSMNRYYILTKGMVRGAMNLRRSVQSKGLLPGKTTLERLSLPKVKGQ